MLLSVILFSIWLLWKSPEKVDASSRMEDSELVRSDWFSKVTEDAPRLTREEIRQGVSGPFPAMQYHEVTSELEASMDLYCQLGALDGRESLTFLFEESEAPDPLIGQKMAFALSGWMEKELDGALGGARELLMVSEEASGGSNQSMNFSWNGKSFCSYSNEAAFWHHSSWSNSFLKS